jgi:hypothetical protein
MKHIHLIFKYLFLLILVVSCIPEEPEGTFNLSEEAQKYKIDSTITSFQMIDNNGITEQFYLSNFYSYYHEPWENGFFENYNVEYRSIINDYTLRIHLGADDISDDLNINWNGNYYVYYYFDSGETYGDPLTPDIKLHNSIVVQNVTYFNIIELDYTNNITKIDDKTPVKTYISGTKGLIKLIRKDGNILERIIN